MPDVRLVPAARDDPDVRRLTAAQQAELRARHEGGHELGTSPSAADVAVVLVARVAGGEALGCARDCGWTTLRLETGPRQPEAVALYEGVGYRRIAAFGPYGDDADDSLFYGRVLDRA